MQSMDTASQAIQTMMFEWLAKKLFINPIKVLTIGLHCLDTSYKRRRMSGYTVKTGDSFLSASEEIFAVVLNNRA